MTCIWTCTLDVRREPPQLTPSGGWDGVLQRSQGVAAHQGEGGALIMPSGGWDGVGPLSVATVRGRGSCLTRQPHHASCHAHSVTSASELPYHGRPYLAWLSIQGERMLQVVCHEGAGRRAQGAGRRAVTAAWPPHAAAAQHAFSSDSLSPTLLYIMYSNSALHRCAADRAQKAAVMRGRGQLFDALAAHRYVTTGHQGLTSFWTLPTDLAEVSVEDSAAGDHVCGGRP